MCGSVFGHAHATRLSTQKQTPKCFQSTLTFQSTLSDTTPLNIETYPRGRPHHPTGPTGPSADSGGRSRMMLSGVFARVSLDFPPGCS